MTLNEFIQAVKDQFVQERNADGDTNTLQVAGRESAQAHLMSLDDCFGLIKELQRRGIKASLTDIWMPDNDEWLEHLQLLIGESVSFYLEEIDSELSKRNQERLKH